MKSRYDLDRSIRVTNMKLKSLRLRKKMDDKMVDKMVLRKKDNFGTNRTVFQSFQTD